MRDTCSVYINFMQLAVPIGVYIRGGGVRVATPEIVGWGRVLGSWCIHEILLYFYSVQEYEMVTFPSDDFSEI